MELSQESYQEFVQTTARCATHELDKAYEYVWQWGVGSFIFWNKARVCYPARPDGCDDRLLTDGAARNQALTFGA
jgi:hypothetical protein